MVDAARTSIGGRGFREKTARPRAGNQLPFQSPAESESPQGGDFQAKKNRFRGLGVSQRGGAGLDGVQLSDHQFTGGDHRFDSGQLCQRALVSMPEKSPVAL
jgi:hypothetical protein